MLDIRKVVRTKAIKINHYKPENRTHEIEGIGQPNFEGCQLIHLFITKSVAETYVRST